MAVVLPSLWVGNTIGGQDERIDNRSRIREHISAVRAAQRLADDGGVDVVPVATPTVAPDAGSAVSEPIPDATEAVADGGVWSVSASAEAAGGITATVTFYVCSGAPVGYSDGFCGTMASGATVYEGAVACGGAWALGTRLTIDGDPTGRVYVCEDRGHGGWHWIDVFWWDYAEGRAWRNQLPMYVQVVVQ